MNLNLQNPTELNEALSVIFSSMGVQIREAMQAQVQVEVGVVLERLAALETLLRPPTQ